MEGSLAPIAPVAPRASRLPKPQRQAPRRNWSGFIAKTRLTRRPSASFSHVTTSRSFLERRRTWSMKTPVWVFVIGPLQDEVVILQNVARLVFSDADLLAIPLRAARKFISLGHRGHGQISCQLRYRDKLSIVVGTIEASTRASIYGLLSPVILMLPASSIEAPTTSDDKSPLLIDRHCGDAPAMKDLRVEITDERSALYIALDPDGKWAKTTQPDDLITIDWDRQGRVIGIEAIGSAARHAIQALLRAVADYPVRDPDGMAQALDSLLGSSSKVTARGSSSKVTARGSSSKVTARGSSSKVTARGSSSKVTARGSSSKVTARGSSSKVTARGSSSKVTAGVR